METEPVANLFFNARARSQFFNEADYVHVYISGTTILLHGYKTAKSSDSVAYRLMPHRGRGLVAPLPNSPDSMRLLKALFRAGLTEDRSFFRLVKNPGERGWLELELLDRPSKRLEPTMRVTEFIEPPLIEKFDMEEWSRLVHGLDSEQPLDRSQVDQLYTFVISAHRIVQFHERMLGASRRKSVQIADAESVKTQFLAHTSAIGKLAVDQPAFADRLEHLSVVVTGQGLPVESKTTDSLLRDEPELVKEMDIIADVEIIEEAEPDQLTVDQEIDTEPH